MELDKLAKGKKFGIGGHGWRDYTRQRVHKPWRCHHLNRISRRHHRDVGRVCRLRRPRQEIRFRDPLTALLAAASPTPSALFRVRTAGIRPSVLPLSSLGGIESVRPQLSRHDDVEDFLPDEPLRAPFEWGKERDGVEVGVAVTPGGGKPLWIGGDVDRNRMRGQKQRPAPLASRPRGSPWSGWRRRRVVFRPSRLLSSRRVARRP